MNPVILYYYYGAVDGVFSGAVDLYYNLRQFMDIDLKIYTKDVGSCITHLSLNNNKDLLKNITNDPKIESEIVICSSAVLYDEVFKINCSRLIILDSLDIAKSIHGAFPMLDQYIPPCDDIYFLANPSNLNIGFFSNQIEYYQKLSKERINKLPIYYRKFLKKDKTSKPFFREIFNYKRTDKEYMEVNRGQYFENVGRLIFEHILYDCKVNYHTDGMFTKDGLYYYLKLFDVDGEIDHIPLPIKRESVKDKLFMKEDDLVINLIKG